MFSDDPKLCFPVFSYYAVVRMDPEAMLRTVKLDDEQALDEVRRMPEPKKYLVYLKYVSNRLSIQLEIYPISVYAQDEWMTSGARGAYHQNASQSPQGIPLSRPL